jgi:hypothetical protein
MPNKPRTLHPFWGLEDAIANTGEYFGLQPGGPGVINRLLGLMGDVDPVYLTSMGAAMPAPQLGNEARLGELLDRYRALSQSPFWEGMPRTDRLMLLRGAEHRPSRDLISALQEGMAYGKQHRRMGEIVGKVKPEHLTGGSSAPLESEIAKELLKK